MCLIRVAGRKTTGIVRSKGRGKGGMVGGGVAEVSHSSQLRPCPCLPCCCHRLGVHWLRFDFATKRICGGFTLYFSALPSSHITPSTRPQKRKAAAQLLTAPTTKAQGQDGSHPRRQERQQQQEHQQHQAKQEHHHQRQHQQHHPHRSKPPNLSQPAREHLYRRSPLSAGEAGATDDCYVCSVCLAGGLPSLVCF